MVIIMPIGPCAYEHRWDVAYGLYTWINHQSQGMTLFWFVVKLGSQLLWFTVLWRDRVLRPPTKISFVLSITLIGSILRCIGLQSRLRSLSHSECV